MQSTKVLIIDDESVARDIIRIYLNAHNNIIIAGEYDNGLTAVKGINQHKPDLIFLDIQMPGLNGFEVLGKFQPNELPVIIFTTAYDQFAFKAFEVDAIDYLLKPFDKERFNAALYKAISFIYNKNTDYNGLSKLLETYHKLVQAANKYLKQITIKESKRIFFIKTEDIYWIEAAGNYVTLYTHDNKSYLVYHTLNELETKLSPEYFCRVHRSAIVNMSFIKELVPHFNNEYYIFLKNNSKIKMSRTYRNKLQELLNSKF